MATIHSVDTLSQKMNEGPPGIEPEHLASSGKPETPGLRTGCSSPSLKRYHTTIGRQVKKGSEDAGGPCTRVTIVLQRCPASLFQLASSLSWHHTIKSRQKAKGGVLVCRYCGMLAGKRTSKAIKKNEEPAGVEPATPATLRCPG
jgi:hypothetical protein